MNSKLSSDIVYSKIKDRIISGYYLPGVHLVEADLIEEYNFSRTTIREALRRLVDDQIVELIPNRGVRVKKFSNKEIMDSYILYEYLIGLASRLVAESADPDVIQKLEEILSANTKQIENGDFHLFVAGQITFHSCIINSTGNMPLIRSATTQLLVLNMHYALWPLQQRINSILEDHIKLLNAIKSHNADLAEEIIREDIRHSKDIVARELR